VDATKHQQYSSQYGVKGFPTLKYFPPGPKKHPQEYSGPRTASGIVGWCHDTLDRAGYVGGPAPEINQIVDNDTLNTCLTEKKICVVASLPHISDGLENRKKYIDLLGKVAKKHQKQMVFWWFESGSQQKFEQAFNLEFNAPSLIAINHSKKKWAGHKLAFDEKNILDTLNKIIAGSVPLRDIKGDIPSLKTQPKWDGKAYVPPAEDL